MLQIGICDDARESRFQLRVLLERALEGRSAPARLLEFSSGDALLGWMDRHAGELDLCLLYTSKETNHGTLVASAPELIRHYMELRGIGVIDVRRLFGMGAIKMNQEIDMVIKLEPWDDTAVYDRLGLERCV